MERASGPESGSVADAWGSATISDVEGVRKGLILGLFVRKRYFKL
jgi:hypothetical protein